MDGQTEILGSLKQLQVSCCETVVLQRHRRQDASIVTAECATERIGRKGRLEPIRRLIELGCVDVSERSNGKGLVQMIQFRFGAVAVCQKLGAGRLIVGQPSCSVCYGEGDELRDASEDLDQGVNVKLGIHGSDGS